MSVTRVICTNYRLLIIKAEKAFDNSISEKYKQHMQS